MLFRSGLLLTMLIVKVVREGLRYLIDMLDPESRAFLLQTPVFVPHARIADNAKQLGLNKIVLTEGADSGILAGLRAYNWPE